MSRTMHPADRAMLDGPVDQQVDFYAFVHIGNPKQLDDILTYPLDQLVDSPTVKGVLVMYVMNKKLFPKLLAHISKVVEEPDTPLPQELVELHKKAQGAMETANANLLPVSRVRILTPYDFEDSFLAIRHRLGAEAFEQWFGHTTYDAPKFVDALLRLRMFGNALPVLRFDVNVLFSKYTKDDMSNITKAISQSVDDFKTCLDDPYVQSFVVSQQYSGMKSSRSEEFNAWNEAYSTRANPALLATDETTDASQWNDNGGWGNYLPSPEVLQAATNGSVLMAFYGLQKVDGEDMLQPMTPSRADDAKQRSAEDILKLGNAYIGANPSRAVISGAALALGPGVSVDMPPFLHTDLNIMWIDDHLLDRMNQEVAGTKRHPRPKGVGTARVIKARSQPKNLAKYTLELYMPTLIYGIFMDAWVNNQTAGYLSKFLPADIPRTEALEGVYAGLMSSDPQGPWSSAFETVGKSGKMLSDSQVEDLKSDMWRATSERAKDVYWQWGNLPQSEVNGKVVSTFATLWGTGRVCEVPNLASYCTKEGFNKLGQGLVTPEWDKQAKTSQSREELPALSRADFNPEILKKVDQLADAAVRHLRFMLIWPDIVQAIRNEAIGEVPSDIAWHNKAPIPELGQF